MLFVDNREDYALKVNYRNPFRSGYKPELDVTDKLGPDFQQIIYIWAEFTNDQGNYDGLITIRSGVAISI